MLNQIAVHLQKSHNTAFVINDKSYSYQDLAIYVKKYYRFLEQHPDINLYGLVMHNDIQTYAFIVATFLSDCGYVILNLVHPIDRNALIASEAKLTHVVSSVAKDNNSVPGFLTFIDLDTIEDQTDTVAFREPDPNSIAYILFTSGSTGNPKGVQITKKNLSAFAKSIFSTPIAPLETDKFLQLYDLTFDASILMLVPALCIGATIYTTRFDSIKIMDIARILTTYPITYVFLVPSVISLLRNYIPDISIQSLRMLLLGGEPVSKVLLDIIKPSVPNASIWNFYGPTEATVGVVIGEIGNVNVEDLYNDIIPIGKPMPGVMALIMNEGEVVSKTGEKGELWVGGDQVTVGYVNDDIKNMNSFQYVDYKGKSERFYTTGDLVSMNSKGNYTYCGRKDYQVKIQGYRIELNEIEYHAAQSSKTRAVVVVHEAEGNQQLYLFLENYLGETGIVTRYLEQKLPPFMVPKDIIVMHQFPISSSGKVDRMKLLHEVSD